MAAIATGADAASAVVADDTMGRIRGALLGAAIGDALGAPFEGKSRKQIMKMCGESGGKPTMYYPYTHMGVSKTEGIDRSGYYTDDTNSVLAVSDSLIEKGGEVDPDHLLLSVARAWRDSQSTTPRIYPTSSERVMTAVLDDGMQASEASRAEFEDGSYANGGPSRLVALGLLRSARHASTSLGRSKDPAGAREDGEGEGATEVDDEEGNALYDEVALALLGTHSHEDAIDAAFVFTKALGLLAATSEPPEMSALLDALVATARTQPMRTRVQRLRAHLGRHTFGALPPTLCVQEEGAGPELYGVVPFQVDAPSAVACALWSFLYATRPEDAIVEAVSMGGDTDSVACMAGALVGAAWGGSWVPAALSEGLEAGALEKIEATARALHGLATKEAAAAL
mmetsp:Transcript_31488/g.54283  ORF Transcript_31488/g.54283 Transcript_31488/m.54283 type:complete len:398 (+) Transcript_31488:128-1321(+)